MKAYCRSVVLVCMMVVSFCMVPKLSKALGDDEFTDPDIPIDGGVGILVAAGVAYGIKKVSDQRKKKINNEP